MKYFIPSDQSDVCVSRWNALSNMERIQAFKQWINNQADPSVFAFWLEKSPKSERKDLQDTAQSVFAQASQSCMRSNLPMPIDYMISLEKAGFPVFKMLGPYQLDQLVEQFNGSKNMHLLKMCKVRNGDFHINVLRALCRKQIKIGRFETLWNALDWEWMVKTNGSNVILGLSELGMNAHRKKWSDFIKILTKTHGGKTLVKRALNFPHKDDWVDKIYLYAAGLEIWGGECVVPSRKPTLSQSFKDAMDKIQNSYYKPPNDMVEFVESFLLRDYLISEMPKDSPTASSRRKI